MNSSTTGASKGLRAMAPAMVGGLTTAGLWCVHIALRENLSPGDPWRLLVTGLLVAAFGLWVAGYVQLSRTLDEFQRQRQELALSIAFPVSLVAAFGVSFFAGEGVPLGMDPRDLPAVMIVAYLMGIVIAWWRYR